MILILSLSDLSLPYRIEYNLNETEETRCTSCQDFNDTEWTGSAAGLKIPLDISPGTTRTECLLASVFNASYCSFETLTENANKKVSKKKSKGEGGDKLQDECKELCEQLDGHHREGREGWAGHGGSQVHPLAL
jgi:hypothetical protein